MAESLFALSIRSRCELGGRGVKNRGIVGNKKGVRKRTTELVERKQVKPRNNLLSNCIGD